MLVMNFCSHLPMLFYIILARRGIIPLIVSYAIRSSKTIFILKDFFIKLIESIALVLVNSCTWPSVFPNLHRWILPSGQSHPDKRGPEKDFNHSTLCANRVPPDLNPLGGSYIVVIVTLCYQLIKRGNSDSLWFKVVHKSSVIKRE